MGTSLQTATFLSGKNVYIETYEHIYVCIYVYTHDIYTHMFIVHILYICLFYFLFLNMYHFGYIFVYLTTYVYVCVCIYMYIYFRRVFILQFIWNHSEDSRHGPVTHGQRQRKSFTLCLRD